MNNNITSPVKQETYDQYLERKEALGDLLNDKPKDNGKDTDIRCKDS